MLAWIFALNIFFWIALIITFSLILCHHNEKNRTFAEEKVIIDEEKAIVDEEVNESFTN